AAIPSATRASQSGWAWSGSRTSATACPTCASISRMTSGSWSSSGETDAGGGAMKVPLSWLREYVDVDLEVGALAGRLTQLGMEVQGIESRGSEWRNVVVGELLAVEK